MNDTLNVKVAFGAYRYTIGFSVHDTNGQKMSFDHPLNAEAVQEAAQRVFDGYAADAAADPKMISSWGLTCKDGQTKSIEEAKVETQWARLVGLFMQSKEHVMGTTSSNQILDLQNLNNKLRAKPGTW